MSEHAPLENRWIGRRALLIWSFATAACAGLAWVVGYTVCYAFLAPPFHRDSFGSHHHDMALQLAAGWGVGGLLIGTFGGFLLSRGRHQIVRNLKLGPLAAMAGAVAGVLTPSVVTSTNDILPLILGTALPWIVAGVLSGAVACVWSKAERRLARLSHSDPSILLDREGDACAPKPKVTPGSRRSLVVAGGWAYATALCAATAWMIGFVNSPTVTPGPRWDGRVSGDLAWLLLYLGSLGLVCGFVVGFFVGILNGSRSRAQNALTLGVIGAANGGAGSALTLLVLKGFDIQSNTALATTFAWAFVGLTVGTVAFLYCRVSAKAPDILEDDVPGVPGREVGTSVHHHRRTMPNSPAFLLTPILGTSALAFVLAAFLAHTELSVALIATGVLGLSVSAPIRIVDRRIRELERRFQKIERRE